MTAAIIGFLASLVLIFLRVPIIFALAITGFFGFAYATGWVQAATMLAMTSRETVMSSGMAVIPLFILMGNLMVGTGVSRELYKSAQALFGRKRGGLASATILACGGFGMVCGSTVATVVTMGKVALPSMREYKYSDSLSTATIAAGATLGVVIPPSILLVVYGLITDTDIGALYAAALLPGLLGIAFYMAAIKWSIWRRPESAPPPAERALTWGEIGVALLNVWPVLLLFFVVLGGIYAAIFTVTEGAGIGAFGALLLALARRQLTWHGIYGVLVESAESTVVLFALLIGGGIFTEFLNYTGAHKPIVAFVAESGFSPTAVIAIICAIYFILGALMDELSMVLITVPVFLPIVVSLGYDPVWFGVVVIVLCCLGMITPPIGINLFVVQNLEPSITLSTVIRGIVPFIVADLLRLTLIVAVPVLSLYLPALFLQMTRG